ncbi:MAG: hypothetical protein APR62_13580 [Smithella sp. SDB]|nr:MAG: hypothetical protein APR62_13580 [Smithella sp. SDB]
MNEKRCIRVLLIEDNPGDARLIREILFEDTDISFELLYADRLSKSIDCLDREHIDIILLDLGLPDSQGLDTLSTILSKAQHIPVIVETGLTDKKLAIKAVKAGAQDYLIKGQIDSTVLIRSICYAIERKKLEEAFKASEKRFRTLINVMMDALIIIDWDGTILFANKAAAELVDLKNPEEGIGLNISEFICEEFMTQALTDIGLVKEGRKGFPTRYKIKTRKGTIRWVESIGDKIIFNNKEADLETIRDITESKETEEIIRDSERYLMEIIQFFPDPTMVINREGKVTAWNRAMEELTGVKATEIIGKGNYEYALPFYGERRPLLIDFAMKPNYNIKDYYNVINRHGKILSGEAYIPYLGNGKTYLQGSATALYNSQGEIIGAIESMRNITERKRLEEFLKNTTDYLEKLIAYANAPIIVWNQDFKITRFNRAFEHLTGYKADEVIGTDLCRLFPQTSRDISIGRIQDTLKREYWESVEIPIVRKDGTARTVLWNSANIYSPDGDTLISTIAQGYDITERKMMEETLERLSTTDNLTGLYNRYAFINLAEQQLKIANRENKSICLIFLDLDGLKNINDTLGHMVGDHALRNTAMILRNTFRETDIIARVGGDEFAILATTDIDGPEILKERLNNQVNTFNYETERNYKISISIGFSIYQPNKNISLDDLMSTADNLMYQHKKQKRSKAE